MAPPRVPMVPPPTAAPMAAPDAAPTVSACEAHPATPASANKLITIPVLIISLSIEVIESLEGLEQRSMLQTVCDCYQSLRVQLELTVDLHRDAARKRDVAHGGARVLAVFRTPQFEEEVGSAVDD